MHGADPPTLGMFLVTTSNSAWSGLAPGPGVLLGIYAANEHMLDALDAHRLWLGWAAV